MVYIYIFLFGYFFSEFKKIRNNYLRSIFIISIVFLTILFLSIDVITNQGLTRSFWFHIQNNVFSGSYAPFFLILVYEILKVSFLFIFGLMIKKKFNPFQYFTNNKFISLYLIIFFLIFNPSIVSSIKNSTNTINDLSLKSIEFKKNYFELENLQNKFKDRDIVFIAVESLERTFYSNKQLQNLNLKLLNRQDVIDFSNIEEINGYTDWTIAGLVAANCGIPILNNGFYSSYNCLSDLLSKLNYKQKFIQGSSPEFAGNGNFYKIHNINEIIGPKKISKIISEKNLSYNYWGLHDHIVLSFAIKEIIKLENNKSNYAIWLNTLDNHAPNGFLSDYCKNLTTEIKEQILKTTYCTDLLVNKFINNVFENDFDKNNLIVVYSDHLLMGSPIIKKYFKDKSERSNLFLIIDPYKIKKKKIITSIGNTMDIPASIVDYLGEGKKFGLGKSLFNENQNNSLSNLNVDTDKILKKFEKNLIKINKKVDLAYSNIILEKKAILLDNGFKAKIPVFLKNDKIIQSNTDINGNPREIFDTKLFNLTKKDKEFSFEAVANCYEVKNIIKEFNISCDYTFIQSTDSNGEVDLILKPFFKNGGKVSISDSKNINIKINKNDFIERIEKLNKPVSFFKVAYKNFRAVVGENLESNYPKVYTYMKKIYINTKYIYFKIYFKIFLKSNTPKNYLTKNDTFIAHAGGLINNDVGTNSLEALDKNYKMGSKYLELDLKLTSDNVIVAVNDWDSWKKRTGYKEKLPPTYRSFMKYKIDNKYSPLSEYEIKEWFLKQDDTYLIIDKIDDFEILNNVFFDFKERLIVQLFSDKSIENALLNKDSNILISQRVLWQKKFSEKYLDILFLKKIKPYGFVVHNEKVYENPKFFKKAKSYGFKTYVYGMNDGKIFNNEKDVLCDLSDFIDGIYSDKNLANKNIIEKYCD
tara:strand:+ start:1698 stop:4472 length:2775 start_codon:yes stop_codon:yes gene_type:complete